ncbi:TetR/AcrR family transcriptional regulator [Candidatus Pantoea bituminis]|uniref:TetR/AcrR family transcriptional regulator n=1 Tax=Candidatus Pantoea bituminis TaxID=2831036 RepID=UPI001C061F43|nr:TetR/AcrR family transcriptional regulator [Pantoea bituminis]
MTYKSGTYTKLLDAAFNCFAEKGYAATSVREITQRAGISQGAMYTYFTGKEELFIAIVLEEQRIALSAYDDSFKGNNLERIYEVIFKYCLTDSDFYPSNHNHLWLEMMAESSRNDILRDYYIKSDIILREGIHKFLRDGIKSGEFPSSIDLEQVTIVIFSLIDGLMARKAINNAFDIEKTTPDFIKILKAIICS